jgi:hypothetical protein
MPQINLDDEFGSAPAPKQQKASSGFDLSTFGDKPGPAPGTANAEEQASASTTPTKQYEPGSVSDVAKSLGSGVELGVAQVAGLPGDVARAVRYLGEGGKYYVDKAREHYGYAEPGTADKNWKDVEAARESPNRSWVGPIPTSEALTELEKKYVPGANYEPKSREGAVAQSVGSFLPSVFGGEGSIVKRLGTAAIAGAGSELAGQATEGTPYEGIARVGGALLSPVTAEKTLSRPLGSVGSALGVSDKALGSVGLTSGNMAARQEVIQKVLKAQQTGDFTGLSSKELQFMRDQEIAQGGPEAKSAILSSMAVGGAPADVMKMLRNNADLDHPALDAAKTAMYNGYRQMSTNADNLTSSMLKGAEDEAMLSGLNNWLIKNKKDMIDEPPKSFQDAVDLAKSVRDDIYRNTFTPIFNQFPSVLTNRLENTLKNESVQKAIMPTIREMNSFRDRYQEPPVHQFYSQNGGKLTIGFNTPNGIISGAPLEFWDRLANQLYSQGTTESKNFSASIRSSIDDYFKSKKMESPLKAARKTVGDIKEGSNALQDGANFIHALVYETNPLKREAALSTGKNLTDIEAALYQAGALRQASTILAQGEDGVKHWNNALSNSQNRALTRSIFDFTPKGTPPKAGPSNYDTLNRAIEIAQQFHKDKVGQMLSNTKTSRSFFDRLTAPAGLNGKSIAGVLLSSAERAYLFGTPYGAIALANGGYGYVRQILQDRRARKMFNMLASNDPAQAIALAKEIESSKLNQTSWQKIKALLDFSNKSSINFYRRAAIAANNQQPQPTGHQTGGRVGYGPGGEVDSPDDAPQFPNRKVNELGFYSRAAEALRGFPNQEKPQDIARLVKTLHEKHDVHPDEMRYTGITTPESHPKDIRLSDTFGGMGEMSPADLAEHIENQQPKMMRRRLGETSVSGKPQYKILSMDNPHLSNYGEDVYHFPERKIDKHLEWQADPTKWTVKRDQEGLPNVYNEYGSYIDTHFNDQLSDDDAIRITHGEEANERENKTSNALNFKEGHYANTDNLNKSGWIRHNVATFEPSAENPNGAKFKNIEEIQPERAQKAEKKGIISEPYNPNIDDQLRAKRDEASKKLIHSSMSVDERNEAWKAHRDYHRQHVNDYGKIADAPYTNSVEASTKRYVRQTLADAVNEGLNGVSITPWYRNAERAGASPLDHIRIGNRGRSSVTGKDVYGVDPVTPDYGFINLKDESNNHLSFDPTNITPDTVKILENHFGKQTTKRIVQGLQEAHKTGQQVKLHPLDEEDPLMYAPIGNGHVIDGHRYYYRDYLPRVLEKEARRLDPGAKVQGLFRLADPKGKFKDKMGTHQGVVFSKKFMQAAKAGGFRSFKQGGDVEFTNRANGGRINRSTGGRIPEVDKLFKQAKKALDDGTKPMLNMPDDAIVHALRIAQGRV